MLSVLITSRKIWLIFLIHSNRTNHTEMAYFRRINHLWVTTIENKFTIFQKYGWYSYILFWIISSPQILSYFLFSLVYSFTLSCFVFVLPRFVLFCFVFPSKPLPFLIWIRSSIRLAIEQRLLFIRVIHPHGRRKDVSFRGNHDTRCYYKVTVVFWFINDAVVGREGMLKCSQAYSLTLGAFWTLSPLTTSAAGD